MPTYGLGRPGVFLQENLVQQSLEVNSTSNATAAFIGYLTKGPETPTYVTSWADFTKYFGGLDYNLPMTTAAYMFFANGGRNTYIRRVTKGNTAIASITSVTVAGTTVTQYIIFHDSSKKLIAYFDTSSNLPVVPNGGNITLQWSNTSDRIFKL
jgi:hypothetical protein